MGSIHQSRGSSWDLRNGYPDALLFPHSSCIDLHLPIFQLPQMMLVNIPTLNVWDWILLELAYIYLKYPCDSFQPVKFPHHLSFYPTTTHISVNRSTRSLRLWLRSNLVRATLWGKMGAVVGRISWKKTGLLPALMSQEVRTNGWVNGL